MDSEWIDDVLDGGRGLKSRLSEIIILTINLTQDILEKFEFFPVKCRLQRALEVFVFMKPRLNLVT